MAALMSDCNQLLHVLALRSPPRARPTPQPSFRPTLRTTRAHGKKGKKGNAEQPIPQTDEVHDMSTPFDTNYMTRTPLHMHLHNCKSHALSRPCACP